MGQLIVLASVLSTVVACDVDECCGQKDGSASQRVCGVCRGQVSWQVSLRLAARR